MALDLATIGLSVLLGGGSAYGGFQFFGGKWLDHRFNTRLEESKQELQRQLEASKQSHATETERLKFRIAGLLDRSAKLNQREFEVLPQIWEKLDEAYRWAHDLISPWRSYPDLSRMSGAQLATFIEGSRLQPWQKVEISELDTFKRQTYFGDAMSWLELHEAQKAAHEFGNALTKGGIYLSPEVYQRINYFAEKLSEAVRSFAFNKQYPEAGAKRDPEEPSEIFRKNGQAQYDELAEFIRGRFWEAPEV